MTQKMKKERWKNKREIKNTTYFNQCSTKNSGYLARV